MSKQSLIFLGTVIVLSGILIYRITPKVSRADPFLEALPQIANVGAGPIEVNIGITKEDVRKAIPNDYAFIKTVMEQDLGRTFTDVDLDVRKGELDNANDPVQFFIIRDQDGNPIGFISAYITDQVYFRPYYFLEGKKDLTRMVPVVEDILKTYQKDAQITICPQYSEIQPFLEKYLGSRFKRSCLTDSCDWAKVYIPYNPALGKAIN
jgi:hypothetical protein